MQPMPETAQNDGSVPPDIIIPTTAATRNVVGHPYSQLKFIFNIHNRCTKGTLTLPVDFHPFGI